MTIEKYEGPAELYLNNRLLAEAVSANATVNGNNRRVYTMHRGLAGKSNGPRESEIEIESAIPRAGYEKDFLKALLDDETLRVVLRTGGKRLTFECWIDTWRQQSSSEATAQFTVSLAGPPPTVR